ncbi:MAG: hypothetical protein IH820_09490, partial [Bacteroidetes bacterium]|nr:hypothetical protein [Bacteroidota bacterium]
MKVLYAYVLLVLALILTASPAVSQVQQRESFVVKVAVSDEAVTFHTEGNHTGYAMTVAGPDDFRLEQSFAGDEIPSLRLKTKRGMLANGSYMIQVTAHPYISKEARAKMEKLRAEGDQAQMRKILKEAIGPQDMVYSINVGIAEGKFLDPFEEEPVEEGKDMGALEAPAPRLDAPVAPGYVAAPDVTATGPQYAFQTASKTATPQFINAEADPGSPWVEAYFKNAGPDGSSLVFQGYIRPVESENGTPLFEGYFRPVSARGASQGTWHRSYFEFSGNGFRQINQPGTATAGQQPFDYLTDDDPAQTDAPLRRDQVILDDLIVDGSACIGFDCVNGESFGFDTIRIKENNLRIRAQDTSSTASFPSNDWQITFNDSSNGGANKFSIDDITGGRTPFTIEASAPSNSLYVDDGGRLGLGTSTPVVDVHIKSGNTPTLRLEQDGSSGFTPQTWDVAGNETNFFIRDVTNGSTLPFRIFPGAPSNALTIEAGGGDIALFAGGIFPPKDREMLHEAGVIGRVGRIEDGNTVCDYDELEKELKQSLDSAIVHFDHAGA